MDQDKRRDLPHHVGIIMDGNGRWAARRGLPRNAGHRQGAEVLGAVTRHARAAGVRYLTVYAFSTENWSRPREEIDGIMNLLRRYLKDMEKYRKDRIRIRVLGGRAELEPDIREQIDRLESLSAENDGMNLNIALNYGGRDEILRAVRMLARRCQTGEIRDADGIDGTALADCLYTAGQPDVDLVIRTSGEMRISNFLLWQSAYAEYVFSDVLWPDFTPKDFDDALARYAGRSRRMGGV